MARRKTNISLKNAAPPLMSRFIVFSVILFAVILAAGSAMFVFSMKQIISTNKGNELSQTLEIERIKLENSVNAEIAIALKLADSYLIKRHFENPSDAEMRRLVFYEMESYRRAFENDSVFWVNDIDKIFYTNGYSAYIIDPEDNEEYWYNMTLYGREPYNLNINYNFDLNVINLWINAQVLDDSHKPIGVVGTGINLSSFIDTIYKNNTGRTEIYFFNAAGEITGARDITLVTAKKNIKDELDGIDLDIISEVEKLAPEETLSLDTPLGKIALGTIPSLEWYSIAVLPDSIDDYKTNMTVFFFVVIVVIALLFIIFNVFIARLLNPLRKTMDALVIARDEAENANRSKTNFLATMSHEIRTPMNAILGIAQIEMGKDDLPSEQSIAFEKIKSSGNILLGIINDILDLSKIESGKLELNPADYDIPSLINDAVQLNIVRIGSKPIKFILNVDEKLPSRLCGDELRLKQILNNLLSNAIKYTKEGHVKLTVNHSPHPADALHEEYVMLRFFVEDTGQGMKHGDLKKLFSEHLRFNAEANRTTEGAGLGLNITRRLVEMMDGVIEAESEYGRGSTFIVTVKQKIIKGIAGREHDSEDEPSGYTDRYGGVVGAETSEHLRKFTFIGRRHLDELKIKREQMPYGKVLIVDDVEMNIFVAEGLLSPYKLQIETVNSGFAAIEKIESGKIYDIIFMDHMMPLMDGIETMHKLRAMGYDGTIIAFTANVTRGIDEMFKQNGFNDFLSKPIDIRQLNSCLHKYVRDRHLEEAEKYKQIVSTMKELIGANPKLLQIFRRDAEKAIVTLMETYDNGDIKLFTTTVHAMKSALATIGEDTASKMAASLEIAGLKGEREFIAANTEIFLETLETLITKYTPDETSGDDASSASSAADTPEDTAFLTEQLSKMKADCEGYNRKAAYALLDTLKEKQWKADTAAALEEIHETLSLHSDFDGAVEKIDALLLAKK